MSELTREQVIEITEENPVYLDKLALLRQTDAALRAHVAQFTEFPQLVDYAREVQRLRKQLAELDATIAAVEKAISVEFAKKDYTDEDRQHKDLLENFGVFLDHHKELEAHVTELEAALKAKETR